MLTYGCGTEPPLFQTLPLEGSGGEALLGNWYAPGGTLELIILRAEEGELEANFRMRPGGSELLAAWTDGEDLHLRVEGLTGPRTVTLRRLQGPNLPPPGSNACLGAHHAWLFRDPHPSWIALERLREHSAEASRRVGHAVDWLVKAL